MNIIQSFHGSNFGHFKFVMYVYSNTPEAILSVNFGLFDIVGTPRGNHLGGGGVQNVLLERGDKLKKGGCHFFITLQFNRIFCVCGESKGSLYYFSDLQYFELAIQDSHPCLYCTKTWYHLYISDPFW